jgi:hypothetical protein
MAAKGPIPASTSGRDAPAASAFMRSTARFVASISTPAALYELVT